MQKYEIKSRERLELALMKADTTQHIQVGYDAIKSVGAHFNKCFPGRKAFVVADQNTFKAAGSVVQQILQEQVKGTLAPFIFKAADIHAEMKYVDELTEFLKTTDAIPVAVGSGTINDLAKLSAYRLDRHYMVVVTAASVDGYTAFGASITADGFKQTFQCPAPLCVIADLDVLAQAPVEMNAWGYADLIAKIPAGADWILADALGVEAIDDTAWKLVQDPLRELTADPVGVSKGDGKALCFLIEGLILSGLAMQALGSSRPASGAEHQFSHLWDIENHKHDGVAPSHGFKVAVGSLSSLALYEQILTLPIAIRQWDISEIESRWISFKEVENQIRSHFKDPMVARQIIDQAEGKYVTAENLYTRLISLSKLWPEIKPKIERQIVPFQELKHKLASINGPEKPEDIGIDLMRLKNSFELARYIRARYTILDVAHEMGVFIDSVNHIFSTSKYWQERYVDYTLPVESAR